MLFLRIELWDALVVSSEKQQENANSYNAYLFVVSAPFFGHCIWFLHLYPTEVEILNNFSLNAATVAITVFIVDITAEFQLQFFIENCIVDITVLAVAVNIGIVTWDFIHITLFKGRWRY